MPKVVPPMAKTIIRIGMSSRSRPRRRDTICEIAPWIAPVFIVIPRNPPITSTKSATSMAPNSSPEL